jgi:chromosome segregation ATPase
MLLFCRSLVIVLLLSGLGPFASADDIQQATVESRLRDALRNTMLQLRDAQGQVATLQATQAQSDKDNADLKAKIDALNTQVATLTKQSANDRAVSDQVIADLKTQVARQADEIKRVNEALTEWKAAYNQVSQLAEAKEKARADFALQAALSQRTVEDRERKNLALYQLGNEILVRYEKFSLGEALGAKEPFAGLTRVKLQELVQDYKDKLLDQTAISGQPIGSSGVPPPAVPAHANQESSSLPKGPPKT